MFGWIVGPILSVKAEKSVEGHFWTFWLSLSMLDEDFEDWMRAWIYLEPWHIKGGWGLEHCREARFGIWAWAGTWLGITARVRFWPRILGPAVDSGPIGMAEDSQPA